MSKKQFNYRLWNIILAIITIYSMTIFYLSMREISCINNFFIKFFNFVTILLFIYKEKVRRKYALEKNDPHYNFMIENFWNISFLFIVASFLKMYNCENLSFIFILSLAFVSFSFIFRVWQFIKYTNTILLSSVSIISVLALGYFNDEIQGFLTLIINLISIIFGDIFLKEKFKEQISNSKKDEGEINTRIKYNLALINIGLVCAFTVVKSTEWIKKICLYKTVVESDIIKGGLYIGIIRYAILALIYLIYYIIFSDYDRSKRIKDYLFNLFIENWDPIEKKDKQLNEKNRNEKEK